MKLTIAIAAMLANTTLASAATFDFTIPAEAYEARTGTEGSWEQAVPGGVWTVDGIGVSLDATGGYPFMDTSWSKGDSPGAGVCNVADCNGSNQDGIYGSETMTATFSQSVSLSNLFLRESTYAFDVLGQGRDHTPLDGRVSINDAWYQVTAGNVLGLPDTWSDRWTFAADEGASIYLTSIEAVPSPVPVPAAGMLLLGAFGGLAMLRRRKH